MRILITGGCGFVGFWTATRFLAAGHDVIGYDRRIDPDRVAVGGGRRADYVEGDILDPGRLLAAMRAHEVAGVVHAAALISQQEGAADPVRTYRVNVEGTLNVLEAVRAVGARMVYVSTATLYGRHPDLHLLPETACPEPIGIYDTTKLMAETLAITYHKVYGLDVVAVRPGYVFGPFSSISAYFLDRVVAGESVVEAEGADLPMDLTYVKDLAEGIYLAMAVRPLRHRIFNVTGGVLRRRREVAEVVQDLVPGARIRLGPGIPAEAHLRGPCDLTRAREELGYVPRYTLESGMADWLSLLASAGDARS